MRILYGAKTDYSITKEIIEIMKMTEKKETLSGSFYMVVINSDSFHLKEYKLYKPNESGVDLITNYNDDFLPVHEIISTSLKNKSRNGIVLLHGKFGTGKTSYLRHLISTLDKRIIFLPPLPSEAFLNC